MFQDLVFILGIGTLLFLIIFAFLSLWGRWFLIFNRKKGVLSLLKIKKSDRVLILVPHPDDETLATGGLISELSRRKIPLKIVFLTNGDGNLSLFWRDKRVKFSPAKFVKTGQERMDEAVKATRLLGVKKKDLIFLGYLDGGLWSMQRNPEKLVASKTTKLNHCPYFFSSWKSREYRGINVIADIKNLLEEFQPTVVFVPHRLESNSDHRAVFLFFKKAAADSGWQGKEYQYLIHLKIFKFFRVYPLNLKCKDKILYPPRRFGSGKWFSFWLQPEQMRKKKIALAAYQSQVIAPTLKLLFRSFLAQNEIFEEIDYSLKSSKR